MGGAAAAAAADAAPAAARAAATARAGGCGGWQWTPLKGWHPFLHPFLDPVLHLFLHPFLPSCCRYVPSIGHFILQQSSPNSTPPSNSAGGSGASAGSSSSSATAVRSNARGHLPAHRRPLPRHLLRGSGAHPLLQEPPRFDLRGLVIGNGLTDPLRQVSSGPLCACVCVGGACLPVSPTGSPTLCGR